METVLPGFVRVVRFELGFGKNGLGRESRKAPQGVELDDAAAVEERHSGGGGILDMGV